MTKLEKKLTRVENRTALENKINEYKARYDTLSDELKVAVDIYLSRAEQDKKELNLKFKSTEIIDPRLCLKFKPTEIEAEIIDLLVEDYQDYKTGWIVQENKGSVYHLRDFYEIEELWFSDGGESIIGRVIEKNEDKFYYAEKFTNATGEIQYINIEELDDADFLENLENDGFESKEHGYYIIYKGEAFKESYDELLKNNEIAEILEDIALERLVDEKVKLILNCQKESIIDFLNEQENFEDIFDIFTNDIKYYKRKYNLNEEEEEEEELV